MTSTPHLSTGSASEGLGGGQRRASLGGGKFVLKRYIRQSVSGGSVETLSVGRWLTGRGPVSDRPSSKLRVHYDTTKFNVESEVEWELE